MNGRWWRAYDEAVDDPKLILLTDRQHRTWFNLCCISSQSGGALPTLAVIAVKLRITAEKARHAIAELAALRLIDGADGRLTMHNWSSRQFKSDVTDPTNAERQRRYRERNRVTENAVTGTVTDKRPDTDTETDTEPETEEKEDTPSQSEVKTLTVVRSQASRTAQTQGKSDQAEAGRYPAPFEDLWREYRVFGNKNANKGTAFKRWQRLPAADREPCFWGLARYGAWLAEENRRRLDGGRSHLEVKHLETFIGGRGWESFMEEIQHAAG